MIIGTSSRNRSFSLSGAGSAAGIHIQDISDHVGQASSNGTSHHKSADSPLHAAQSTGVSGCGLQDGHFSLVLPGVTLYFS